ncbi:MAG: hypothetical protein RLZ10_2577, partial [Bacteroidota bacterium]
MKESLKKTFSTSVLAVVAVVF